MYNCIFSSLEMLQALHYSLPNIRRWVQHFRTQHQFTCVWLESILSSSFTLDDKPVVSIEIVHSESFRDKLRELELLTKEDQTQGPAVEYLTHCAIRACLKFDALYTYLYQEEKGALYPCYYKHQIRFIVSELKMAVADFHQGPEHAMQTVYTLAFLPEDTKYEVYNGMRSIHDPKNCKFVRVSSTIIGSTFKWNKPKPVGLLKPFIDL